MQRNRADRWPRRARTLRWRYLSIGVAEYPDGGETPEEPIATADAAMYRAKSAGRNQVVVSGTSEQPQQPQEKRSRRKRDTA